LKRFDHVIAVSPFVETYLRLRHRFEGEIRVIPNAIPHLPGSIQVVGTFPKSGRVTFGCYGDPGGLKNIEAAMQAFSIVRKELPESRLVVFGERWGPSHACDVGRSIEVRGMVKHDKFLQSLASEIDIWVHPSRIEAHPITICEAIQAGCPVIAGRASGGVPWTLEYGRAGLLVDIEHPGKIAEAMLALVRNRERSLALVSYARRMVSTRFSPERVLDLHLEYYRDVVREWRSGHARN
jgi:glycosyltransferase involved in cell wall biosynthesis